jgi:hypothetical protein
MCLASNLSSPVSVCDVNTYLSYIQSVVTQRNLKFRHLLCSTLSAERPSFISYFLVNFLAFINVSNRCRTHVLIGVPLMIIIDLLIGFFFRRISDVDADCWPVQKKKWPSYRYSRKMQSNTAVSMKVFNNCD